MKRNFEIKKRDPKPHRKMLGVEDEIDQWGWESFPASDPPSHGSSYREQLEPEFEPSQSEAEKARD